METSCLAVDFGASSGRVIMGNFDGEKITLKEIHRFSNNVVKIGKHVYWDFFKLFYEMKEGLKKSSTYGIKLSSIGVDTWGVDYGLLDDKDNLIGNPLCYRDNRTDNIIKDIKTENKIDFKDIFNKTGIQYMPLNTIYQLYSDKKMRTNIIDNSKAILFMPDLFNFYLTGVKRNEYTIASTSQMLNVYTKNWDKELINKLSIPVEILGEIIMPGNIIGSLSKDIKEEAGIKDDVKVVAVASHDTASAVAATPLEGEDSAYLSCGTWSLLGIENSKAIVNKETLESCFTNEGGVFNTIRFLTNINGLYIIQKLRENWCEHVKNVGFQDIIKSAEDYKNADFIIDPNDESFIAPQNMVEAIKKYCISHNQGEPKELGEIAIAAYNGLAKVYKDSIERLERVTGRKINTINMVGGGIQDQFLCQLTADITKRVVKAGPVEASVMGNIMMQLIALGKIKDLEEGRIIIKNSIIQKEYFPNN